jgi:SAM-dependent methyltransferase
MHPSAMNNCKLFFDTYSESFKNQSLVKIVEIGSQNVNGTLRSVAPTAFEYVGVDFVEGDGVDIILDSPYSLPFKTDSVDIVLSSSCFEHSEMFWLVYLEILRILKPSGLFYLNVPSNGDFHSYPVDCWRFYPDSGNALVSWSKKMGFNSVLLESYTSNQNLEHWNDFVAVFLKDEGEISNFKSRIVDSFTDFINGKKYEIEDYINFRRKPEDQLTLFEMNQSINNHMVINRQLNDALAHLTAQHEDVVNSLAWKTNLLILKVSSLPKRFVNKILRIFGRKK